MGTHPVGATPPPMSSIPQISTARKGFAQASERLSHYASMWRVGFFLGHREQAVSRATFDSEAYN